MKNTVFVMMVFIAVMTNACCVNPAKIDGPYEGKIVDADTGEPIEGVVVLAEWNKSLVTPAGSTHTFYDAEETVTNQKGEFRIKGKGILIMSRIDPIKISIFKAGYEYIGTMPWYALENWQEVKWEGEKAIIPLKKLTIEERKEQLGPFSPPGEAPLEKVILMLREIDKDRVERGLDARQFWNGKRYE
jgi:hypothetical protein